MDSRSAATDDLYEAVALGIVISCGDFERGTGLIPQAIFDRLYEQKLVELGSDIAGESFPRVTGHVLRGPYATAETAGAVRREMERGREDGEINLWIVSEAYVKDAT